MDQKLLTDFRSELLDSRFGAKAISTIAESKRFPLHEMRDDVAFQIINDELYLDGNARQNLATFCQTWDDENVHKLMDLSINKNWIDKEEYPQSAAIDGGVSGDVGGVGRHVVVGGFELRAVNGVSAAGSQVASGDISDFAGGFGAVCGTECCAVSTTEHPAAGRTIESRLLHRCWLQKPYL